MYDEVGEPRLPSDTSRDSGYSTGALNDRNDPNFELRNNHAEIFYAARRNSKKEPWVRRIAQNSDMREKAVSKIFDHVFITEHDLWDGRHVFPPDYDTAHRITERKYNYAVALREWYKRSGIPWSG